MNRLCLRTRYCARYKKSFILARMSFHASGYALPKVILARKRGLLFRRWAETIAIPFITKMELCKRGQNIPRTSCGSF